jgi:hypothetical protein
MAQFFVKLGGKVFGPASSADLRAMAADGRVQRDTLISASAAGPWRTAERVRGLFPETASIAELPVAATPAPVAVHVVAQAPMVQTIQATGKVWKAVILMGTLLTIASAVVFGLSFALIEPGSASGATGAVAGLACLGTFVGLFTFILGRIGAWWFHG